MNKLKTDTQLPQTIVSSSFIFDKYLKDECPVCYHYVDSDSFYSHKENGGKCMAKYFRCRTCGSEYTIGYNRNREPIDSEITFNRNVE